MKDVIFYANGCSGNHGCEAITRSLTKILSLPYKPSTLSINPKEDEYYELSSIVNVISISNISRFNIDFIKCYLNLKLRGNIHALELYPYIKLLNKIKENENVLAISIGGDNYCYGGADYYGKLDAIFHKRNIKTALVGCSIEPDIIIQPGIVDDLSRHTAVIARESITYKALKNAGLNNVHLIPDPAFMLDCINAPLPYEFQPGNTVGINLSPLVEELSSGENIVYRNAVNLIEHIIHNSDMSICLIPHVVWPHSNDFKILTSLYEKFWQTGRISLIADAPAEVLKGYISRCRFMIAARTHASIAAYSTNVPTFVLGYSVKSRGIARDIFGDDANYVKSTKEFTTSYELIDAFEFLKLQETEIKAKLRKYISSEVPKLVSLPKILGIK